MSLSVQQYNANSSNNPWDCLKTRGTSCDQNALPHYTLVFGLTLNNRRLLSANSPSLSKRPGLPLLPISFTIQTFDTCLSLSPSVLFSMWSAYRQTTPFISVHALCLRCSYITIHMQYEIWLLQPLTPGSDREQKTCCWSMSPGTLRR